MGSTLQTQTRVRSAKQPAAGAETATIARIAYEFFERRGKVDGYDQQDWFEAERLVRQRRSRA